MRGQANVRRSLLDRGRLLAGRPGAYVFVAIACALPRIVALAVVHGRVLGSPEKSWWFARTFVASGTFGFIPGEPSASTQPLYGFFLVPLVWLFGPSGWAVGLVQTLVAVVTALLVYEVARRLLSPRAALVAAAAATLQPYLVWHDVHVNREILDQLLGAALVLATLVAAERRSARLAALAGLVGGLAILSNTRLALLPLLLAVYLLARVRPRRTAAASAALVLAGAAVAVAPWVARNAVVVGCPALTTDARALWKANNPNTYATLAAGKWIDDVPPLRGAGLTPQQAFGVYQRFGTVLHVDECAQMSLYERQVLDFWRRHPAAKARLAAQAVAMLWSPTVRRDASGQANGSGVIRGVVEPAYVTALFVLAAVGLLVLPRSAAALLLALFAYETAAAAVFAGTTRYRVPWDFLLAVAAGAALAAAARQRRVGWAAASSLRAPAPLDE